jgi:hypothetical protein
MGLLRKLAIIAALTAIPFSQADSRTPTIIGFGTASCGEWTSARAATDPKTVILMSWVGGYLSAYNVIGIVRGKFDNITGGVDGEGLWAWIDNYCSQNPLDSLAFATTSLAAELLKRQGLLPDALDRSP